MPIVASRGMEIRRLIGELMNPGRRPGALLRLRSLGARVVPHVAEELGRLDVETRRALFEALADLDTPDARALLGRLARTGPRPAAARRGREAESSAEATALGDLRALPPPRAGERPAISRERGEAHLALARGGSRLARRDLLLSLETLAPDRVRLYCEAAGLIGDSEFIGPLARLLGARPEAGSAIKAIAARERITRRSKVIRALDEGVRPIVVRALEAQ